MIITKFWNSQYVFRTASQDVAIYVEIRGENNFLQQKEKFVRRGAFCDS